MKPSQNDLFVESEGDKYFDRNQEAMERFDPQADLPLQLMRLYRLHPRKVLEIGASNGFRIAAIAREFGASVVGIEASAKAVADGTSRFTGIRLLRGEASNIPLEETFDLIIVHFVLHWIDRSRLFQTIAEIDRLLDNDGLVLIGDFHPTIASKVPYHHVPDQHVFTYKQDYAAIFLASGLYQHVALLNADTESHVPSADGGDDARIGVWLLKKRAQ